MNTFTGLDGGPSGGVGLLMLDLGTANLDGGTYNGGNADPDPAVGLMGGTALALVLSGESTATINSGSFEGGSGPQGQGYSLGLSLSGSATLTIQGATFGGGWAIRISGNARITATGTGLTFSNGRIRGTVGGIALDVPLSQLSPTMTVTISTDASSATITT